MNDQRTRIADIGQMREDAQFLDQATPGGAAAGYSRSVVKGGFPTYCTRFAGVTASWAGPALGAAPAAGVARTCFRAALR
jgi:hypothetical protein